MKRAGTLFDQLDEEWPRVLRAAAAAGVPARWAAEDETLAPFTGGGLEALLRFTEDRTVPPEAKDRVLVALASRVDVDELAVRMLVQALLPGARAVAHRFGWLLGGPEEAAGVVVTELWARVRTYPFERRPGRVAANVLCDVHGVVRRMTSPAPVELVAMDDLDEKDLVAELDDALTGTEELLELLAEAVRGGKLTTSAASLIAVTRLLDVECAAVAQAEGVAAQSVRKRRQRAETLLGKAARVAA